MLALSRVKVSVLLPTLSVIVPVGADEPTAPCIDEAVPPLVMVTPPTVALPAPAVLLKVPACVALVGGLAVKGNVVGDLKIVTASPPVKSVEEKAAVNVAVALAATDGPL